MVEVIGGGQIAAFEPFEDYVLVDIIPIGVTAGGVALPAESDCAPPIAKVLKTGPGRTSDSGAVMPMPCREGDTVLFKTERYRPANEIELDGKKVYLMRVVDIMGRLKKAA